MNFSLSNIIAGIFFGLIGMAAIKVGKTMGSFKKCGIGAALLIYPYFIESDFWVWALGGLLTVVLLFWRDVS